MEKIEILLRKSKEQKQRFLNEKSKNKLKRYLNLLEEIERVSRWERHNISCEYQKLIGKIN